MPNEVRNYNRQIVARSTEAALDAMRTQGELRAAVATGAAFAQVPEFHQTLDENGDVVEMWTFGDPLDESRPMG